MQDEEEETRIAAFALEEEAGEMPGTSLSSSSTVNSHRRRRMLAQHHKHFLERDTARDEEDDQNDLMMAPRDEHHAESGENESGGDFGNRSEDETTNMLEGRLLPEPPTGGNDVMSLVQLEQKSGETARALVSYIQWLRTHQVFWHSVQGQIIDELHISLLSASIQVAMMSQALAAARGNFLPAGAVGEVTYRPLLPSQAVERAASLVGEIREH